MKANYSYLSDGTKASVLNASGAGYDYNGTFTYSHASGGTRALESVAFGGGRIRKNGSTYAVDYYVTDHLGSVRAIVNASGTIVEQNDFYPFGTRQQNGLTTLSANRWRFSGKEGYDNAFGIALDDFGARRYDRTAWTSIDPLAEKYYNVSPYAYCNNNPICRYDQYGLTDWKVVGQGTLTVVGGVCAVIGGIAAASGTGCLSGLYSAYMVSNGCLSIGAGLTLVTIGFIDEQSLTEDSQSIPTNIPEIGGVIYDELSGNENHIGKTVGSAVDFVIGAGPSVINRKINVPTIIGAASQSSTFALGRLSDPEENQSVPSNVESYNQLQVWDPNQQFLFFLSQNAPSDM